MMFRAYLIVGLLLVIPRGASCQLNSTFETVLKKVLDDSVVAAQGELFNGKWNRAYVFYNKQFDAQVSEYDSTNALSKQFYTLDSALTTKLFATHNGLVWLFYEPDVLAIRSKYGIETVIVIDQYKVTKSKTRIVFHTTNCYSRIEYKGPPFKKFKCDLVMDDNAWIIRSVNISLIKFKSIVD